MKAQAIVLIPTYNRSSILRIALKNLNKSTGRKLFDICVVDNGSSDGTKKMVQTFKGVRYYKKNKNVFISKALNHAFSKQKLESKYQYLVVMANDVLVNKVTVRRLVEFMDRNPNVGVSGPKHFDWLLGTKLNDGLTISPITSLLKNCDSKKTKSDINHFHSCFIVRTDAFHKVGGFKNQLFPMIYEEPDLGNRVLKLGYEIKPCKNSRIWHPIELSKSSKNIKEFKIRYDRLFNSSPKAYLFFRNRIIYMRLHSNILQFFLFYLVFNPLITLAYLRMVDLRYLPHVFRGIVDGTVYALTKSERFVVRRNKTLLNI